MIEGLSSLAKLVAGLVCKAMGAGDEATKFVETFSSAAGKGIASFAATKKAEDALLAAVEELETTKAKAKFEDYHE